MSVYLIHFNKPLAHARHYMGFADGDMSRIEARLKRHKKNRGSALMAAVNAAGIDYSVSRVWLGYTRDQERQLKNQKNSPDLCPLCKNEKKMAKNKQLETISKNYISLALQQENPKIVNLLDDLKGSYAVEYMLEELLRNDNTHTLQSALELIKKNRK